MQQTKYRPVLVIVSTVFALLAAVSCGTRMGSVGVPGPRVSSTSPIRIALVLEQVGLAGEAARAVSDGVRAAQAADRAGNRTEVAAYPVAANGSPGTAIRAALAGGAHVIVGPIDKEHVRDVGLGPALPVPTLVLNRLPRNAGGSERLVEFAMAPDAEAHSVAERAGADGFSSALILYPDSGWGQRMRAAFEARFVQLGGTVVRSQSYAAGAHNYVPPVRSLLQQPVQGNALIFMVASAQDAQILWPTVSYFNAQQLPTLATSHINTGDFRATKDSGLVGMFFVDSPWMLDQGIRGAFPRQQVYSGLSLDTASQERLYAWGIDAYSTAKVLARSPETRSLHGVSGPLSLSGKRVHRSMILGYMDYSGPMAVVKVNGMLGLAKRKHVVEIGIRR